MKLFKLSHVDPDKTHDYDSYHGFVIRAESEDQARQLAQSNIAAEHYFCKEFWLNSEYSSCEEVFSDGDSEVILYDYAAG